jgi:hypothetical protein
MEEIEVLVVGVVALVVLMGVVKGEEEPEAESNIVAV